MPLGQEVEVGLGALPQPLPNTPPEPMAMVDWMMWKPLPSGSEVGVEQGAHPVFLVLPQPGQSTPGWQIVSPMATMAPIPTMPDHRDRQDEAPGEAGKEEHEKARAGTRMAVPRSGCLAMSPTGSSSKPGGDEEIAHPQHALAALEVPGEHQRHGDLHQFGRLDARDADVEPAPGALGHVAEQGHANQQQHPEDIDRQRNAHQFAGGGNLRQSTAPPVRPRRY
jgi:hypothetical protein